jgi:hypothetical protein
VLVHKPGKTLHAIMPVDAEGKNRLCAQAKKQTNGKTADHGKAPAADGKRPQSCLSAKRKKR